MNNRLRTTMSRILLTIEKNELSGLNMEGNRGDTSLISYVT